ncbi:hypothetical protein CB0940_02606 [Cercospora beticola]|uniref:Uncharacterized protein n=1 Tax=Cercospora beticola TaxID=122368 RepID=A0A2G5I3X7_CERBT|nr:hypothetical protein CB0940_02606 [Cercospora beticola]PIA99515.1 hypothetical protein CB0940_02606 [Cercospora beticola]WPA99751.1 hypothetical protein RHO25_004370 [Cercospora beticola]CAK1362098.1 unnamed protein product [Cercospora beticola]
MTVFGVVRSVIAIAISLATADLDFAKQVREMLDYMKYIDNCDTLGRKTNQSDIHKALVSVYGKILEFYSVALDVLTRRGLKLFLTMIWEKEHLLEIVQDFLKHANNLGRLVNKATLQITIDIKEILTQLEIY